GQGEDLADVASAEAVFEHRGLEALAVTVFTGGGDARHQRQIRVDDAGAIAAGAGALGVGAEQGRLDAVGLRERLADRLEQARVGGGVTASGAADRGLVDGDDPGVGGEAAVDEGALAGAGDAGDDAEHSEGDVDVDLLQVVLRGLADRELARGLPHLLLEGGAVIEVLAREGAAATQPLDAALVTDGPACGARAGPQIDDVVG